MSIRVTWVASRWLIFLKQNAWALALLIVVCVLGNAQPAHAFSCSMSATNMAFNSVDVTAASAVDVSGTLTVTCSGSPGSGTAMRMCVNMNGGTASDSTRRLMNGPGAAQLGYQFYSDAARTVPWGSWPLALYNAGVTWDVTSTGSNTTANLPYYGRVLSNQQAVTAGSYTSTLSLFYTFNNNNNNPCPSNGQGNSTSSFSASATVPTTCSVSATNLDFGTAGLLTTSVDATTALSSTCTNATPYNLGLSVGNGAGATVSNRKMTVGGSAIGYSLYRDNPRTLVWGTTIGTDTASATGSGFSQSSTVYGRVPAQTSQAPGVYTDTIVVTLTY